ncbi:DNA polymerase, bacteriophage-type [Nautilia profundicola AmH]|uniref:DNA polymerase, bacteriophage-type n=1 Tax=Nautilia profundicola (strain ATCC BAA-1463 / DSM 18972 / AmH) TaxID=598659 RepID=B9L7U8_NAUPA|nr:uracil-DNA glycosylase [Nautilia profundicola]ACM93154.1 DNA polymerase, bacteriophage-type [Nautilia profundicola AmH]
MDWKEKLYNFYKSRREYIKTHLNENIDFTDVYDPYIIEKRSNPIMIIGEAPGANEVRLKQPFVGKAGENLAYLIETSGFDRAKDFLITNAFPFRTFEGNKNRTPKAGELKTGAKLLEREIEIVKPRLILLLGNSAIKAFSYIPWAKDVKNLQKCGIYDINGYKVGLCFHPSPLAFNRKDIRESLENFFKGLKTLI